MFRQVMHYLAKYTLMFSVYTILLTLCLSLISPSIITFLIVSTIYLILIKYKIIVFSSSWLD